MGGGGAGGGAPGLQRRHSPWHLLSSDNGIGANMSDENTTQTQILKPWLWALWLRGLRVSKVKFTCCVESVMNQEDAPKVWRRLSES